MKILRLLLGIFILGCVVVSCDKDDTDNLMVGVYGGSISSRPASEIAKQKWENELQISVITHGVGGAGFSNKTEHNVPEQIAVGGVYDIYVLWASSNDFRALENMDINNIATQDGGIKLSCDLIKAKSPDAVIVFFTSIPRFDKTYIFDKVKYLVEEQIKTCEKLNIPYLDQYNGCGFNEDNYMEYYEEDKVHLTEKGYLTIVDAQISFLREIIQKIDIYKNSYKNEDYK